MKFFVDTAEVSDIKDLLDLGLIDGVTNCCWKAGRSARS